MPLATARNEPPAPRGPDYVIVDESAREPAAAAMARRMAAPEPAEPPSRGKAHSFLNLGAWAVAGLLFGFLVFGYLATRTPDEKPPQPVANAPAVLPGDHSPTETAKEAPRPSPVPEDNPPNEADRTSDRRIDDVLRKWTDSTRHLDADGNADLYAPRVERFFNRRNVTRDDIRVEKERLFENIDQVRKFQVSNVVVDRVSPDQALISFRKEWDFAGKSPFSGAEKARMLLKRNGSQWQIAREEEIAVEWTKGKKRR